MYRNGLLNGMSIYIELLLVALVVDYIVGLSGWTDTWLGWLSKFTAKHGYGPVRELRPFSCPQCMTWWCCLAWCILQGEFTLPLVAYSAGLAFFSVTLENVCISIREATLELVDLVNRWMRRD